MANHERDERPGLTPTTEKSRVCQGGKNAHHAGKILSGKGINAPLTDRDNLKSGREWSSLTINE